MEKKTTQRIMGILFAIALIIILVPLLSGKKYGSDQANATNEPPFPTTQTQLTSETPTSDQTQAPIQNAATPVNDMASVSSPTPSSTESAAPVTQAEEKTTHTIAPQSVTKVGEEVPPDSQPQGHLESQSASLETQAKPIAVENSASQPIKSSAVESVSSPAKEVQNNVEPAQKISVLTTKITKTENSKSVTPATSKLSDNLKKTAWVVQMGSFKDRDNAQRLADRLRVAGYKAFMQEVKSQGEGSQIRVYVGPEYKHASATKISKQLEQEMKLQNFVVTYKPLKL